jgi:predicted nucleic acid-binding protein
MLSVRVAIDTNVLVSAAQTRQPPADNLSGSNHQIGSPLCLRSGSRGICGRALAPRVAIRKGLRQQLRQLVKNRSHIVAPSRRLEVTSDPGDNIFIECADAARADYLITGNQKYFPPFWKGTKIIVSREFVPLVAPRLMR